MLYVAADGFTNRFRQAVAASSDEAYLWTIDDLYQAA